MEIYNNEALKSCMNKVTSVYDDNEDEKEFAIMRAQAAKKSQRSAFIIISLIAFIFALFTIGNYQLVNGIGDSGNIKLIERTSFSFKEFFINMDEITGMSYISAKTKYPLSVKALQKAHLIETEKELTDRTTKELKEQIEANQKELMKEYNRLMSQY